MADQIGALRTLREKVPVSARIDAAVRTDDDRALVLYLHALLKAAPALIDMADGVRWMRDGETYSERCTGHSRACAALEALEHG